VRVLHIARFFHPHIGGTEGFIAALTGALTAEGVCSRVIVADRYRKVSGPEPLIPVIPVSVVGPDRFPKPIGGFKAITREFKAADVIHLHDMRFLFETSFLLGRSLHKPVVMSTHGFVFHTEAFSGVKSMLWRAWYVPALRRLERVIAVSRADADLCHQSGISRNVTVLPNPVAIERFLDVERVGENQDGPLLYFGRISPGKGVDRLAATMATADPRWRLEIIGGGDTQSRERAMSAFASVADRVRWRGIETDEVLGQELKRCRCVLLPSRSEGFGMALIEALAAGAPVVASDIPAFREIAPPHGVELVDFDDPRAVVDAIDRVTRRHDPRAAKDWARRFSWDGRAGAFKEIYEQAIARR
jgi:alpha-1,3-mannosyltransferase